MHNMYLKQMSEEVRY